MTRPPTVERGAAATVSAAGASAAASGGGGAEPDGATPVRLSTLTTLRVGGPARRLVTATTAEEVVEAVRAADESGEPLLVLGGGSNLLVADEGFDGTVLLVATRGVQVDGEEDSCGGAVVRVQAGHDWDALVAETVDRNLVGVEALSGIPGSTGATPLQNVGAYGQEVAQTIAFVRTWDRLDGRIRTLANADCSFSYRHSRLKAERLHGGPRFVVLDVTFQLLPGTLSAPVAYAELAGRLGVAIGGRAPLADVRAAVLELRAGKGMVLDDADPDTWSAGSFFTNPLLEVSGAAALPEEAPRWPQPDGRVKTSAAWLIQRAGFGRGHGLPGPAALSTKHTLALTNRGSATAGDLLALAREVRDGVRDAYGISSSRSRCWSAARSEAAGPGRARRRGANPGPPGPEPSSSQRSTPASSAVRRCSGAREARMEPRPGPRARRRRGRALARGRVLGQQAGPEQQRVVGARARAVAPASTRARSGTSATSA